MNFDHIKIKDKTVYLDGRVQEDNNGRPFRISSITTDHTQQTKYNTKLKMYITPSSVRFKYLDELKPRGFDVRIGYNFEFLGVNFIK